MTYAVVMGLAVSMIIIGVIAVLFCIAAIWAYRP
jgi:hypothetical protein